MRLFAKRSSVDKQGGFIARHRRRLIILVLLVFAVWLFFHIINSPSTGKINDSPSANITKPTSINRGQSTGKYVDYEYPSDFQKLKTDRAQNVLQAERFIGPSGSSSLVSVTLIKESLDADSSYRFRLGHPERYKMETTGDGQKVFTSHKDGFEKTTFIEHGGLVLIVAASDPTGQDLSDVQAKILASLNWR